MRFLEILDGQLARRRDRRVPSVDADPAWLVRLPTDRQAQRVAEALGALANGWAGTRPPRGARAAGALPLFAVNGVYTVGPGTGAAGRAPLGPAGHRRLRRHDTGHRRRGGTARMVDLRTGVLVRQDAPGCAPSASCPRQPEALALRAEAPADRLGPGPASPPPGESRRHRRFEHGRRHGADLARVHTASDGGITMAARDQDRVVGGRRVVERLAAWTAARSRPPAWSSALKALDDLEGMGFDRLLAEHREAWAARWAGAESASTARPATSWRRASPCSTCWVPLPTRARPRSVPGA